MPHALSNGTKLYYEETGPAGAPAILFCHEFGGDCQRHFESDPGLLMSPTWN